MTDRRRNLLVLLLVAGLLVASAVGIAVRQTKLGLDLKGGVELVYQAKPTKQSQVTPDALNRAIDIMRQRVDQLGVSEPSISTLGNNQVQVALPSVTNARRAQQQVGSTAQLFFYDWESNVVGPDGKPASQTGQAVSVEGNPAFELSHYGAVARAAKRPRIARPNSTTTNGTWYLVDDRAKRVLAGPEETRADVLAEGRRVGPGQRLVHVQEGTVLVQAEQANPQVPAPDLWYVLDDDPALRGTDITDPREQSDPQSGQPVVTFGFSPHGRQVWQDVTRRIAQRGQTVQAPGVPARAAFQHFAIVLDNQLISVPYIDFTQNPDGIDGVNGSEISGGFTFDSANRLANLLKYGALPVKLDLISQSQVSATLGRQSLHQALIAGLVGFAIVALFLLAFYRLLGLIAVGALVVYAVYFYALIKLIPITLTLPGIAGLILTIGVAADANIVIFERVKEEIRRGRSVAAGIAAGYKRGLASIVDANVVTFLTAFILFVLATAGVKGFAFTLGIGTLVSLFTAVLATSAILGTMSRSRALSRPVAVGAGSHRSGWRFDFMGRSRWFFTFSGVILLVGAFAVGGRGLNFGIDFQAGTRITATLQRPTDENGVRAALAAAGVGHAEVQRVSSPQGGGNAFQISTASLPPAQVTRATGELQQRFGIRGSPNTQSVGPTFGHTVTNSAIKAIIASLLVISAYIALRFEWKYAVPVLLALMHDVLITAGVYALTGRQVTAATIAAFLTILGYSLYDTIIVFDRVRENVPRMPRAAFSQIVNRSMSEVLTRSLATTFCTLLPILAILVFGGTTLKDFAFALLVGVASGAYSSIFIASPVLTHWKEREPVYRKRAERIRAELGAVPAYAAGADVEPATKAGAGRRGGRLTQPDEPGQISREEFDELVRGLPAEQAQAGRGRGRGREPEPAPARGGTAQREEADGEARAGRADDGGDGGDGRAADLTPDEVVMPHESGARRAPKQRRPRNRRHGRAR